MQSKPDAKRLDGEVFIKELRQVLLHAELSVRLVTQQGVPKQPRSWSAMTWVPFFMLVLDGHFDAQVFDGQQMQRVERGPGEGFLFMPHTWVDVHHQRCARYMRITFDEDHVLCGLKDCSTAQQRHHIGQLATYVHPRVLGKSAQALLAQCEQLADDELQDQRCSAYARSLLWECHDALCYQSQDSVGAEATWLAIRDWCARHCCEGISRADVAEAFQLSPGHVSRLCKQFHHQNLIDFIHDLQLRHAMAYLRDVDIDITSVAKRCAFSSANYFIRVFAKHFNCTPKQWQRQYLARQLGELNAR